VCTFFLRGACRFGEECRNRHTRQMNRHPLHKTRMCVQYIQVGRCQYAGRCTNAHSRQELRGHPTMCNRMDREGRRDCDALCRFAHSDEELERFQSWVPQPGVPAAAAAAVPAAAAAAAPVAAAAAAPARYDGMFCVMCYGEFRRDEVIMPACHLHAFCRPCIRHHIMANTPDGDFINNAAPCPECPGVLLTEDERMFCVGAQEWFDKEQELLATALQNFDDEPAEPSQPREFECPICQDSWHVEESTELDCGHRFCNVCFARHVESMVKDRKVSPTELRCPGLDPEGRPCAMELSVPQIMGALSAADQEKFDRFRFDQWEPLDEGEMKVTCPAPNCATFIIDKTLKKVCTTQAHCCAVSIDYQVKYPKCNKEFCPHCSENAHDGTCEQYRQWKLENNQGEQAFNRIAAQQRWKRCPECGVMCERAECCNFMTCVSPRCGPQGGTYFCYICGQRLTLADKSAHFGGFGPFGGCVNEQNPGQARPYVDPNAPLQLGQAPAPAAAAAAAAPAVPPPVPYGMAAPVAAPAPAMLPFQPNVNGLNLAGYLGYPGPFQ